jgi:heme oxygenase
MEILNAAKLPEKRKSKEEAFIKARKELSDTVDMLVKTVKENKSKEDIIKAVEKMHSKYQALEHIFE